MLGVPHLGKLIQTHAMMEYFSILKLSSILALLPGLPTIYVLLAYNIK